MSLQKRLDAIRQGFEKQAPAEALEIMHRATNDLRASGQHERALKEDDAVPPAVASRFDGRPMVATFFRGRW